MQRRRVGDAADQAVERIDLADQMTLPKAADRGVARQHAEIAAERVTSATRAPIRAAAAAASQPAWPPPTTMTSKTCMAPASATGAQNVPRGTSFADAKARENLIEQRFAGRPTDQALEGAAVAWRSSSAAITGSASPSAAAELRRALRRAPPSATDGRGEGGSPGRAIADARIRLMLLEQIKAIAGQSREMQRAIPPAVPVTVRSLLPTTMIARGRSWDQRR